MTIAVAGRQKLRNNMPYLICLVLALSVSVIGTLVRLDLYPTIMIVVASYYGLFAVMGGNMHALSVELVFICAFLLASIFGFKLNIWLVVAALFTHGVFDFFHSLLITNPVVSPWWPMFCLTYDIVAAGYLAWLLVSSKVAARVT